MYNGVKKFFRFYFGFFNKLIVNGAENMLSEGPCVICANHYSDFDVFLLTAVFERPIRFMAKKELFDTPVVKWFAKAYNAIPVDRKARDYSSLLSAAHLLNEDCQIGIFPEGTRVRGKKVSRPKGGAIMLAYMGKCPIIPVKIEFKHKHLHIFNTYTVTIGKPVTCDYFNVEDNTPEACRRAAIMLMVHIYGL